MLSFQGSYNCQKGSLLLVHDKEVWNPTTQEGTINVCVYNRGLYAIPITADPNYMAVSDAILHELFHTIWNFDDKFLEDRDPFD